MKIGIMGGTFDPIHNAHLEIARCAKKQYYLDRLMFMTGGNPPHKSDVTDKKIRNKMTELAVGDEFEINSYEVDKEDYSYTLHTLQHLKNDEDELYFIIGEDSLKDIEKWYQPHEILKLCTLLVFPRTSMEGLGELIKKTKKRLNGEILPINSPIYNISSTQIRALIKDGKNIEGMVDDKVKQFIKDNGLYKDKNIEKLRSNLYQKRFEHSLGVRDEAVKMAECFGADIQKAYIAGMYHDCAKGMSIDEQMQKCHEYGLCIDENTLNCPPVIHAPLGAYIAEHEYGITDKEILNAIKKHSVGDKEMTLLDKIIYVADMIEPMRNFEGVNELREMTRKDIDKAVLLALKQSLMFNMKKNSIIHPGTLECYNVLVKNLREEKING